MLEQYKYGIERIEICSFEVSSKIPKYLICFEKRHFEVNAAVVNLISILQRAETLKDAVSLFKENHNKVYSEKELELLIDKYIKPILGVSKGKSHSFILKKEIISNQMIRGLSNLLKVLFDKKIVLLLLAVACCLEVFFFSNHLSLIISHHFNLYTLIALLLLFIGSSFIHELGHASACRYFGVKHGGIGVGLYLNFPVFYTDVSEVWRLSRKKRLVVNFAGVYFQLLLLIPILFLYFDTYNSLLKYSIFVINLNFLVTLNPFFKFDGYWIMSDLLGVPNLRKRTMELFIYYLKKIRKKKIQEEPFLFGMKKKEKVFMLIYSLLMNVFFVYYFCYILPIFLYDFMKTFPVYAKKIISELAMGQMPNYQLVQIVIMKFIFVGFIFYLFVNVVLKCVHKYRQKEV